MLRLKVQARRAPDAVGDCMRNAAAHAQVLQKYEIGNITSAKTGWWHNGYTYVLMLQDVATKEHLGGIRVQRWGNGYSLPLESALGSVDSRVHAWIASFASMGVGELCGLWCSPKLKGFGIGRVLTRMGLSLAAHLELDTLFGLCDRSNVGANVAVGFVPDAGLAYQGMFEYPRPGLIAQVLRLRDAQRLLSATLDNRAAINGYRELPVGHEIVARNGGRAQIGRDLRLGSRSGLTQAEQPRAPAINQLQL
jgi:hypothetical protein